MGVSASDFDRDVRSQASWLVPHRGYDSPWGQFAMRRYGSGFAATGVAANIAVPRLLRRRWQDWSVRGCAVYLGHDFVSFGRELGSLSRADARLFYGIDIRFGEHGRTSWLWYCHTTEWLLQFHKAQLDPLPPPPEAAPGSSTGANHRWPGRPRYLGEQPAGAGAEASPGSPVPDSAPAGTAAPPAAEGDEAAATAAGEGEAECPMTVEHQLSLFFSNADGHIGLLGLPVPRNQVDAAAAAVARWAEHGEVPLSWGGRLWRTQQDFAELRETALNMPDLLLMGLETEVAMALTPDWTWEKYPRGFGEVTCREDQEGDVTAEGPHQTAPGDGLAPKEEEGAGREEPMAAKSAQVPASAS